MKPVEVTRGDGPINAGPAPLNGTMAAARNPGQSSDPAVAQLPRRIPTGNVEPL